MPCPLAAGALVAFAVTHELGLSSVVTGWVGDRTGKRPAAGRVPSGFTRLLLTREGEPLADRKEAPAPRPPQPGVLCGQRGHRAPHLYRL